MENKSQFFRNDNEIIFEDLFYPIKYIGNEIDENKVKNKIIAKQLVSNQDKIFFDEEFGEIIIFENPEKTESVTYVLCRKPLFSESNVKKLFLKHYKEYYKDIFESKKTNYIETLFNNNTYYAINEKKFNILYGFLNEISDLEDIKNLDYKAIKNVCHRLYAFIKDGSGKIIEDVLQDENYKDF